MLDPKTAYKERIAVHPGGDVSLPNNSDLQSRSHRNICVTQDSSCPQGAWGRSLNKHKKPPVFLSGKQVVLSIWVPDGIACKVTIYVYPMDSSLGG
jgi:hypothetical protein